MGQGQSGSGASKDAAASAEENVTKEIEYLAEHTSLNKEELRGIYEKYFAKDKISKKEFLKEFEATFPK